jgi:hypothetical protein
MNKKMNTKRTLVSFMLIASVLLLASAVSAAVVPISLPTGSDYGGLTVKVNGDTITNQGDVSTVNAGDTLTIQVKFNTTLTDSIKVKATLEGNSNDVTATTSSFDIQNGNSYVKTLTLTVPSDFESDSLTASFPLTLKIGDQEVSLGNVEVQRPSYDVAIKSVIVSNTAQAGTSVPVEVVLKNDGYNDLSNMYVTVKIAELGVEKQVFFGDLMNVKDFAASTDSNDHNSIRGTLNLDIPSTAKAGKYTLTVVASNDDTTSTATQDMTIANSITDLAMKSGNDLVLLNPTNQLVVYTVKYNTNTAAVVIPAASSKTVAIDVPTSGDYKFDVSVYSGDALLDTVNYAGTANTSTQITSPVFVLTVILAIVFLVLLVVLVVLITKKPQKTEEFGESYY